MLEVLCPGVPITYALIEEKLRATLDIDLLTNAAAALGGLFGAPRSRWGMMSRDDKNYIEDVIAKLV
eukprot:2362782-Alexandrium_andersonii.AAC.1